MILYDDDGLPVISSNTLFYATCILQFTKKFYSSIQKQHSLTNHNYNDAASMYYT